MHRLLDEISKDREQRLNEARLAGLWLFFGNGIWPRSEKGQKRTLFAAAFYVRFTPKSGHVVRLLKESALCQ